MIRSKMPRSVTIYRKTAKGNYKKVRCQPCKDEDLKPRPKRVRIKKKVRFQLPVIRKATSSRGGPTK